METLANAPLARDPEKERAAIAELERVGEEIGKDNATFNNMHGAQAYSVVSNDKEKWADYDRKKLGALRDKSQKTKGFFEIEKEHRLYQYSRNSFEYMTPEEWMRRTNSSRTLDEAYDGMISSNEGTKKDSEERIKWLDEPKRVDSMFQFRQMDMKDGNFFYNERFEYRRIGSSQDLVMAYINYYNAVFDRNKGLVLSDRSNKEIIEKVQGIAMAALERDDVDTAAFALAFLEAVNGIPEDLKKMQEEKQEKWDAVKKHDFESALARERTRHRDYAAEAEYDVKKSIASYVSKN